MSEFYTFGQVAEQKEVNYLKEMNYIVLEQNYRYRKAEIDIIAQKNNLTLEVRLISLLIWLKMEHGQEVILMMHFILFKQFLY